MTCRSVLAPAKINLCLRVVGKRPDGYHLLRMVMVPLAFGDEVSISDGPFDGDSANECEIEGVWLRIPGSGLRATPDNLCIRAALALRKISGKKDEIWISLNKNIPVAAGLGGGSSDAAAVLRVLSQLWDIRLTSEKMTRLALSLGADVPFFCQARAAQVNGIGEIVTPYPYFPKLWILLINPGFQVSTADIFQHLDFRLTANNANASLPPVYGSVEDVIAALVNDLEPITVPRYPVIADIKQALLEVGSVGLMSGSGPTVFGLFPDEMSRDDAAKKLSGRGWWLQATENA